MASYELELTEGACTNEWDDLISIHDDLERRFKRLRCPDRSAGKVVQNLREDLIITRQVVRRITVHYHYRRRFGRPRFTIHCLSEGG